MKTFSVMAELTLMYTVKVQANDEAEAQQKAEAFIEKDHDRMGAKHEDYKTEIGDIDEVGDAIPN